MMWDVISIWRVTIAPVTWKFMSKMKFALTLRLQIEFNWIHKLRAMLSRGMNTKDETPLTKGC